MRVFAAILLILSACKAEPPVTPAVTTAPPPRDAFCEQIDDLLLDREMYEMRYQLALMVPNTNRDDESPLMQQPIEHEAKPGPHLFEGKHFAEIEALRAALRPTKEIKIEGDRVYIGRPEVLILGHRHGSSLYVPVKLFARQLGAYVHVAGTFGTGANIWPRETLEFMRREGSPQSAGMLEAHAEGIISGIDVRRPAGN